MQVKQVDQYLRHCIYCIGRRRDDGTGLGMHSTFTFSPFLLEVCKIICYLAFIWCWSIFFLPNTEIMDPLFSFSSSILCGISRKHRGRQAHFKLEGSNVYPWVRGKWTYRSFATRVSQLKIWHFWVISIERNVCRCTFNRYSVITQFAKLAAGEQLCRRCTHRKL